MKIANKKSTITSFTTRAALVSTSAVIALTVPFAILNKSVYADQYDDQINALQSQINSYNSQISSLSSQADTLQNKISSLNTQISSLQAQINLSQAKYDKLVAQIAQTQTDIQNNKDALGKIIADMYVDDEVTPIEMIASSSTISEYLDKQEYRSSVRSQLTSTISSIKTLQAQLENEKAEAEDVLNKQKAQQNSLSATKNQQQELLDETNNQELAYQGLVSAAKEKMQAASAAQKAYFASHSFTDTGATNVTSGQDCGGGYPYCGDQDTYADPWGLYNRECVSYAAWRISTGYGKYVSPFHGNGYAYQWPTYAPIYSGAYQVYDPQPGDAAVLPQQSFAPLGHLMVVESVGSGTNPIHVSQYNYGGTGLYSTMDISTSYHGVIFLRFRDK